jgi:glycosyltransferase involved in cell wall biosynthesis
MQRLTVIIPLYNREAFIGQSLNSLIRQEDACDLSILVVNDGSTDRSPEIVTDFIAKYPFITMVSTANQGVTKTRNVGLRALSPDTEFVSFLDSDDISPPERFAKDLAVFERQPGTQFTYGKMTLSELLDENGQLDKNSKQATIRGIQLSPGIFRKQFIDRIGFFDEGLEQSEDTDYLLRMFETGLPFVLTDTICVYYRRHEGNMTKNTLVARRNIMLAMKKAADRRKANPAIRMPKDIFDFTDLIGNRIE